MAVRISQKELISEIQRLASVRGRKPMLKDMEEIGEYSRAVYYKRFESWDEALKLAGFDGGSKRFSVDSEEDMLNEIAELATGGTPPTSSEMRDNGKYSPDVYYDHFGSWNEAVREAGFEPNHEKNVERVTQSCDVCGDDMVLAEYETDRRFCGRECFAEHRRDNHTGEDHWNYKGRVTLECGTCGKGITREPWRLNWQDDFYCSEECFAEWLSENRTGEDHPRWRGFATVECDNCGVEFERKHWKVECRTNVFCDFDCFIDFSSKPGETRRIDYGKGWNESNREAVREQYDRTCQGCGKTEEWHLETYSSKLAVHHIMPARWFDDEEKRNAKSNLVPLCCTCHKKWEGIPLKPQLSI